ncbi:MAG: hypothetical protein ACREEM_28670 [Blastocatellia bacterium]
MNRKIIGSCAMLAVLVAAGYTWNSNSTNKQKGYKGMEIEINDLAERGVVIHSPSSAGYNNRFSSLLAAPNDLADSARKYSAVVENKTPHPIIAATIIWRFYPSQGEPIPQTFAFNSIPNNVFNAPGRGLIQPGEQYPLCLLLERAGFGRERATEIKGDDDARRRLERVNALIARSVKWSVSVDGVLFSNGVFIGPDTIKYFDVLSARIRGARDIINELQQKLSAGEPNDAVFAHARSYASITDEALEAPYPDRPLRFHNPDYAYNSYKTNMGRQAIALRENESEAKAIEFIGHNSRQQIALIKE